MAAGSRRGEAIGSPADGEASMAAPHGFGPKSSVSITDTQLFPCIDLGGLGWEKLIQSNLQLGHDGCS